MANDEDDELGTEEFDQILERVAREIADQPSRPDGGLMSLVKVRQDIERAADLVVEIYGKRSMYEAVERAKRVEEAQKSAFAKAVRVEVQKRAKVFADAKPGAAAG